MTYYEATKKEIATIAPSNVNLNNSSNYLDSLICPMQM